MMLYGYFTSFFKTSEWKDEWLEKMNSLWQQRYNNCIDERTWTIILKQDVDNILYKTCLWIICIYKDALWIKWLNELMTHVQCYATSVSQTFLQHCMYCKTHTQEHFWMTISPYPMLFRYQTVLTGMRDL